MQAYSMIMADDDDEDRAMIREALSAIGSDEEVLYVENGAEVLPALDGLGALPCLIVLDLNMPLMNGSQVLRALKSHPRFEKIPVVIYTTSANHLEQEACLSLGADQYLVKPLTFTECLEVARTFVAYCGADKC